MDTLSSTKEARIYNGKKTTSLTSGAGKTVNHLQKNETRTLSNTIHKNKLKMKFLILNHCTVGGLTGSTGSFEVYSFIA